jgi:heavy metal sensor kinase
MRSIRLSLIVYFFVLLSAALGAVSWSVYQTTSETLQAKENSTANYLVAKFHAECQNAKTALDERIRRRAQTLAALAQSRSSHYETLFTLGALGAPVQPHPVGNVVWFHEGLGPLSYFMHINFRPFETTIEQAETMMEDHDGDYFQTYNALGFPMEHSKSLGEFWFALDAKLLRGAELMQDHYDDVSLPNGVKLRRVTLKATAPRFARSNPPPPLPPFFFGKFPFALPRPKMPARIFFIQYAAETRPVEQTLVDLRSSLETDLANQKNETIAALAELRSRLSWISGLVFLGLLTGGYWLVRRGLLPLRRLSEAVSRVSSKDFRLQIDESRLPRELRPIASRLSNTLTQLERAFAREKQAAADISHELRTPLAALLTTLDVGLRKQRTVEEYEEILQECRESGQQMTKLVERLLALARLDAGVDTLRPREVDVTNLAAQCVDLVRPLAEARGVTLRVHQHGHWVLRTDPDKLREVLTNLLHNAIEYNRPNGAIDLDVQRDNGRLRLEVRDTGIGIPLEAREHIFERFYRADPSRHADTLHAGIGLAIVKGYVDLMGGTIGVDSSDAGSTFRVEFPVH